MKKQLSLASKRKWVTGGILAFSAVSLLTTGFATWVVGVQRTKEENNITVQVDTASDANITFSAALSDSGIKLFEKSTEPAADVTGLVSVKKEEMEADPLAITFSELDLVYGNNYTLEYTKVVFSLKEESQALVDVAADKDLISDDEIHGDVVYSRATGPWTYLTAPVEIALSTFAEQTVANNAYKEFKATNVTVRFEWGSFFETKSPATFYNQKFTSFTGATTAEMATLTSDVTSELNQMKTTLNGKTLVLVAELA